MLIDSGELQDGAELETAVCVVGAGATGLALARELARTSSELIVVESGGLEPAAGTAELDRGESVGVGDVGLAEARARAFGGTTKLWAGQCLPLDPQDFERRPWAEGSGWPISRTDLDPYLTRAEELFKVRGEPYDEGAWRRFGLTPPPFDPAKLVHRASVYTPVLDLGAAFREELERPSHVRVLLHATAVELETSPAGDEAVALQLRGLGGRRARVTARAFVLCMGAVENARLLLLSSGVPDPYGVVGRYYQDHPHAYAGTVETDSPRALLELYSLLYDRPLRYFPKMGAAPELRRREQVMNGIANLIFDFGEDSGLEAGRRIYRALRRRERPAHIRSEVARVVRDAPQLARAYRRFRRGRSPDADPERIILQLHLEQAPNRDSRVLLGDGRDPLGQPVARVDWRLREQESRTARVLAGAVAGEFERLRLGTVRVADWLVEEDGTALQRFGAAPHHLGTTRMADDPKQGVVDGNCAAHGVARLFACGGSVFPTGGAANPTLTMVALAIRLADRLKAEELREPSEPRGRWDG